MAKINRYTGDLKAFASNSTGTNRTVFGDVTQSDTLDDNVNADYFLGWEIVGVNDKPDKEDFNGLGFTLGQIHAYIHQMGVPEWDSLQEYPATAITNRNGAFYISQQIHTGQDPELDTTNTYWSSPLDMSEFYADSGASNTYVLAPADDKPAPNSYKNGHTLSFIAANANTGASTVNVAGLGVKNIKLSGGADPAAGDIDGRTELVFDLSNDWFELPSPKGEVDHSANGYEILPNGTINQWGYVSGVSVSGDTIIPVVFPIAFPNSVLDVSWTPISTSTTDNIGAYVNSVTLTGADLIADKDSVSAKTINLYFRAKGY